MNWNNTYQKQPYQRQLGTDSGLGQQQQRNCPAGYQYNVTQGKCVPSSQSMFQQSNMNAPQNSQPSMGNQMPQQGGQVQTKPGQSDFAKLLGQAIDINPMLPGIQQANTAPTEQQYSQGQYNPQQMPPQPIQQQYSPQPQPIQQFRPMVEQGFPNQPINQYVANNMMQRRFRELLMRGRGGNYGNQY